MPCFNFNRIIENDDEMNILRSFRDDYMRSTIEGYQLVNEFYSLVPVIVDGIEKSPQKEMCFKRAYSTFKKCIALIRENNFDQAFFEYKTMVSAIKKELTSTP